MHENRARPCCITNDELQSHSDCELWTSRCRPLKVQGLVDATAKFVWVCLREIGEVSSPICVARNRRRCQSSREGLVDRVAKMPREHAIAIQLDQGEDQYPFGLFHHKTVKNVPECLEDHGLRHFDCDLQIEFHFWWKLCVIVLLLAVVSLSEP